jgi:hypothetical protein
MVLSWLGRRWRLLTFVPTLVYGFAVLVSIVFMGLHKYHLVDDVLGDSAGISTTIGITLALLFFIAGLFEPLKGLSRVRGWLVCLLPILLVVNTIIVLTLGAYTSRGVFFMPAMTEAYGGSLLFTLDFALVGSMFVLAGIGIHNFIVGKPSEPYEQRSSTTQRRRRISPCSMLILALTYALGVVDLLLRHAFWVRVYVVLAMILVTLITLMSNKLVAPIARLITRAIKHTNKACTAKPTRLVSNKARFSKRLVSALAMVVILTMAFVFINAIFGIYPPSIVTQVSKGIYLVTNYPAGLAYEGSPTTALAGYFCIKYINPGNDYSIQLNMKLNNGFWVQNTYGYDPINESWGYDAEVWALLMALHGNGTQAVRNVTCGWLVTAIRGGYIYFGYSVDGKNITWYDSYPAFNATYIVQRRQDTNLVLAGWGWGQTANLNNALVYLALYYWNGTTWVPAPVTVLKGYGDTGETVNHAYVYTNNTCSAVVAYPTPTTETTCPTTPAFNP